MRFSRCLRLVFVLLFFLSLWGQQSQPATSQLSAAKDPQAVSIVTQAVNVAGGATAIMAIDDFTATGNATYASGADSGVPYAVTIRGRGFSQLRIDTNFPSGTRSESTNGQIRLRSEDVSTIQFNSQAPLYPVRLALPAVQLRTALISPGFSLLFGGMVQLDGNSAYEVQVQRTLEG